jgi:hypothetical protein
MAVMLTTIDNPYDPFEDFKSWFKYDVEHGYNTCGYLARVARTTDQFTDIENAIEIENAIDEIIEHDFMNVYVKLKK